MSTFSEREEALRRALQSAAASIEPAADGLERIQARLRRPRPVVIAWLEAAWTDICLRTRYGLQTAIPLLAEGRRLVANGMRRAWERFAPTSEPGRALPLRWLRPLAAMSLAIFVIAAATYVGLNGSTLLSAGNSQNSGKVGPGASSPGTRGHQGPAGSGAPISQSGGPGSTPAPSGCPKTPKPRHYSPPTTQSPSATPTPAGSATPTGPPTPTPTPTPSSNQSTTPSPANTTSGTNTGNAGQPGSAIISVAGLAIGAPTASTPTATAKPRRHGTPTASSGPCASKTTAAITPPALQWLPGHKPISQASAQLMTAGLETTFAATRLNRHPAS